MITQIFRIIFIVWFGLASAWLGAATSDEPVGKEYESGVISALTDINSGDFDQARRKIASLSQKYPKSKLAALIEADVDSLVSGRSSPISDALALAQSPLPLSDLLEEAKLRWSFNNAQSEDKGDLVPLDAYALGGHKHMIYVDLKNHRLYVFRNTPAGPVEVQSHYVSIGNKGTRKKYEGDAKTPVGVYFVTKWIPGEQLPDLYGAGAFPINYPNSIDLSHKRTGYGIWLHGVPADTYNRSPNATRGCVALSNVEFESIAKFIDEQRGTPVILTDQPQWISREQWQRNNKAVLSRIEQWKEDWVSLDTDRYLAHYSKEQFRYSSGGFKEWSAYKQRVNAKKSYIKLDLNNINVYRYPGEDGLVVAYFDQVYRSNNISSKGSKELHLRADADSIWRISRESIFERVFDNERPE